MKPEEELIQLQKEHAMLRERFAEQERLIQSLRQGQQQDHVMLQRETVERDDLRLQLRQSQQQDRAILRDHAILRERLVEQERLIQSLQQRLRNSAPARVSDIENWKMIESSSETSHIHIRILEDPLTAQNLSMIISSLTELSTKYWLIAKGRFADLIEYTQTHNGRFAEEANLIITKISHNSPADLSLSFPNFDPEKVANALVTTIDGITQVPKRLKQKELEIQAKTQELQHTEQQADHEKQMASLEQEQKRLEIEEQRLEVLEKQLEVQKKGIEYALEIAGKVVDTLHPGADPAARAMEIQALLPNLIQLQNGKGLELALPTSPENTRIISW